MIKKEHENKANKRHLFKNHLIIISNIIKFQRPLTAMEPHQHIYVNQQLHQLQLKPISNAD
jgi:hypothetical protein